MSYLALSKNHLILLNGIFKPKRSISCYKWNNLRNFHHPSRYLVERYSRCAYSHSLVYHLDKNNRAYPFAPNRLLIRPFHINPVLYDKEPLKPSSKVEETVTKIKEELKEPVQTKAVVKRSLKQRAVDEFFHYYHGFRLLFIDIRVSFRLCTRLLLGKTLTRREHRLLVQTVSDLFRLIPFSVFIIVPFLELLLPIFIKLFPGMLPSTFQTATEKEDKLKQHLKLKLEMAKFWQKTLDDMSVQGTGRSSANAKDFALFFTKIRDEKGETSNEEIKKFIKLFTDEITLDSLSRSQLVALCRLLEINTIGTSNFLLFQLRMKLRNLAADDKMIQSEGVDSLSVSELQQACKARGMRAYGMSNQALKSQLTNWLDLSLNEKVPPTLLLLSKALAIPESVDPADQLKKTIATLPETIGLQTKAKIGESEGKVDHKTKIELIRLEENKIKEELLEAKAEEKRIKKEPTPEELVDKAPILSASKTPELEKPKTELTQKDFEAMEDALDVLGKEKKRLLVEKEELDDLKEELKDYKEDVDDLNTVLKTADKEKHVLRESKAAKRLFNKVNSMIKKMDGALQDLEKKELASKKSVEMEKKEKEKDELVSISEMREVLGKIQHVPDDRILDQITEVLQQMDDDKDGAIRVDDVLKVIELVGHEHIQLDKKQIKEILDLIDKEERIELEQQITKKLNIPKSDEKSPKQSTPPPPPPPPTTTTTTTCIPSSSPTKPASSAGSQCPPFPTTCSEDPPQKNKAAAVAAPPSIPKSNQPPPQAN